MADTDKFRREIGRFVAGSLSGLLQLLIAAATRKTLDRIIACPTYPVPARTAGLSHAVDQLHEAMADPSLHLPTFFAELYSSVRPITYRKKSGQFFTAEAVAEWAFSITPPLPTDDVCDAGAGTAVFAHELKRGVQPVNSYTGVECDAILALCSAHVLDSINAPPSFRIWYANFLLLRGQAFRQHGVMLPTYIVSNPPYVRSRGLAGRSRLITALKSSLGIEISSQSGSVSYFLLRAVELVSFGRDALTSSNARLMFFFPKETAGAAHAQQLRSDLRRLHGWTWRDYSIPLTETSVHSRSNALALCFVFEQDKGRTDQTTVRRRSDLCVGDFLEIKRGISTGCNEFFVLSDEDVARRKIPRRYLKPVLPTRIPIGGSEFTKTEWEIRRRSGYKCWLLALPRADPDDFEAPVREYLKEGIRQGLHITPTAQRLRTWFSIPIPREPPHVLVTYLFREAPHFALNEAGVLHLTNILGGRFVPSIIDSDRQKSIVASLNEEAPRWIHEDHAGREYRGGLRKIEPRELARLPVDATVTNFLKDGVPFSQRNRSLFD